MFFNSLLKSMKEKQEKKVRKDAAKRTAVGLGIGAFVGAVAGILFAPKEGKETRKDIADGAKKAADGAKKAADVVKCKAEESYGSLKTKIHDLKAKKDDCGCGCEEVPEAPVVEAVEVLEEDKGKKSK